MSDRQREEGKKVERQRQIDDEKTDRQKERRRKKNAGHWQYIACHDNLFFFVFVENLSRPKKKKKNHGQILK